MFRIRPFRLVKIALLASCILSIVLPIIWLALPFPPISTEERASYVQTRLAAGLPVVAAWDSKPWRRTDSRALDADWCLACTSVLFHWQFVLLRNKVNVLLAPHKEPRDYWARDTPFELESQFFRAKVWNERAAGYNDTWSPFFVDLWGPPSWAIIVPAALEDEHISQGWFHEVDRHLIQHNFLKWETEVDIRAVIPEPGVVEFWRGAAVDRAFDETSDGWADPLNKPEIFKDHSRTPGIYKQMRQSERDVDLVASFQAPRNAGVGDVVVRELKGDLPSRTWPIRQNLLRYTTQYIVGPLLLFKDAEHFFAPHFAGFLVTLSVFLALYIGVVCLSWIAAGCPNMARWSSTFWLTRILVPKRRRTTFEHQHMWGSSGPIDPTKLDEQKHLKTHQLPT